MNKRKDFPMKVSLLLPITLLLAACATVPVSEQPAGNPAAELATEASAALRKTATEKKKPAKVADYMTEQETAIRAVVAQGVSRQRNILTIEIGGKAAFKGGTPSEQTTALLKRLAPIFARYDKTRISITGYSADTGKPSLNQLYSEKRADIASDILEQAANIADVRIFVEGKGAQSDKIEIVLTPTFR